MTAVVQDYAHYEALAVEIRAGMDEEKAQAEAATPGNWDVATLYVAHEHDADDAAFIAAHSPDRVLARIERDRQTLDDSLTALQEHEGRHRCADGWHVHGGTLCAVTALLLRAVQRLYDEYGVPDG